MSQTAHDATTREYRDKVRKLATVICRAGVEAMRNNFHVVQAARYFNKFYAVDFFEPYDYQRKWFESGSRFRLRLLSAANRIGKTYGGAVEFAYHATGCYPAWWQGYVCGSGILWAIGVSAESTRKVLQKELLGTSDARQKHLFGSGSIPRERINFESFVCDGESVKSFRVFHVSGEESEVHFYSATQDESVLMGQAIVFSWVDEQSEKEDALIAQCTTRTTTTRGVVAVTATPEVGVTDFYARCRDDDTGKIYFLNATWDDAPHLSEEDKAEMLALIPYFQRKMRSKGIPVVGVGAIYPYGDEQITCAPFVIPSHWRVLAALDFGYTGISDPSIVVMVAFDPDTGKKYLFAEWSSEMDREQYANSHMPDYMACKLIGRAPQDWQENSGTDEDQFAALGYPSISTMAPSDGDGVQSGTQQTRSTIMRDLGANMRPTTWTLHETQIPHETNRKSKTGSIALVAQWFQDGDFKIFSTCTETLRELRLYQWVKEGKRTIPSPKNDHFMDAMRYAVTRVEFDGNYLYEAVRGVDYEEVYEDNSPYTRALGAFSL